MENCDLFPSQKDLDIHPIFKYGFSDLHYSFNYDIFRPLRWVDVYARSLFRQKELEEESQLNVQIIYECEINRLLKESPEMAAHFDRYKMAEKHRRPLNPREALYGMSKNH